MNMVFHLRHPFVINFLYISILWVIAGCATDTPSVRSNGQPVVEGDFIAEQKEPSLATELTDDSPEVIPPDSQEKSLQEIHTSNPDRELMSRV